MASVEDASGAAGTVLDDQLLLACGDGSLRLTHVQPAGKGKMSTEEFLRGTPVKTGTVLD